jgi:hypothetical protein
VQSRDARRKPIKRWYDVDIAKALDPEGDREQAIVAFPEDRQLRNFRTSPDTQSTCGRERSMAVTLS